MGHFSWTVPLGYYIGYNSLLWYPYRRIFFRSRKKMLLGKPGCWQPLPCWFRLVCNWLRMLLQAMQIASWCMHITSSNCSQSWHQYVAGFLLLRGRQPQCLYIKNSSKHTSPTCSKHFVLAVTRGAWPHGDIVCSWFHHDRGRAVIMVLYKINQEMLSFVEILTLYEAAVSRE